MYTFWWWCACESYPPFLWWVIRESKDNLSVTFLDVMMIIFLICSPAKRYFLLLLLLLLPSDVTTNSIHELQRESRLFKVDITQVLTYKNCIKTHYNKLSVFGTWESPLKIVFVTTKVELFLKFSMKNSSLSKIRKTK